MGVVTRETELTVKGTMQVLLCDTCEAEGGVFPPNEYIDSPPGWVLLQQKRQEGDDYLVPDDSIVRFCSWKCVVGYAEKQREGVA